MKNWERKKLGEVCIVERGSSPRPIEKYQTDSSDGVNWIKIGDTKGVDKYIYSTKEKITKEGAEKSRYVKVGDFILSNSMSFGKPYIMKTDGYIHDGWFVFRLPDYLSKDYFYYLLTSPSVQEQIQSLGAGAIVKNISGDLVRKVDITYPKSLPEQQRIVSLLDECFSAIDKAKANAEQNLKNSKELFERYLRKVFSEGPITTTIGDQILLQRGFDITKEHQKEGLIPVVSSGGIKSFHNKGMVDSPGVVIGRKGTLGKVFFLESDFWPHDTTLWVKDFKGNHPKFVYYFFNNFDVKPFDSGAANPALNRNQIHPIVITWFSKEQQQAIVSHLDALKAETKKLEAVYRKKIGDLEELKKSILQKAFAGELRGGEPVEPKTEREVAI